MVNKIVGAFIIQMLGGETVEDKLCKLNELKEIQGREGTIDRGNYMIGLYNGLELSIAIMEDREPIYKDRNIPLANNNLGVTTENLTAAESRIRDVDMAKEMMEYTKNNILTQAAQAMLAQANMQPQGVLQLLQ